MCYVVALLHSENNSDCWIVQSLLLKIEFWEQEKNLTKVEFDYGESGKGINIKARVICQVRACYPDVICKVKLN